MKRILSFLLVFITIYAVVSIYFIDKHFFISPIDYTGDILIRADARGEGFLVVDVVMEGGFIVA